MDDKPSSKLNFHPFTSGFMGLLVVAAVGTALYYTAGSVGQQYGNAVFCGIPFFVGFLAALFTAAKDKLTYGRCAASAMWSIAIVSVAILCMSLEGIVCVLMAAPIVIPLALVGAWAGYGVRRYVANRRNQQLSMAAGLGLFPLLLSQEVVQPPRFVEHIESTEIVINASPEKVWPYVCRIDRLPPPTEILFRVGIAYPLGVEMPILSARPKRLCRLSTGDMPEIVDRYEPYQRLGFQVLHTPASMKESGLFGEIRTGHLSGYYVSRRGEFELTPLPGGRTKLVGTSWYANRLAPDLYWSVWTQLVVDQVHRRVMNEIKLRAEQLR